MSRFLIGTDVDYSILQKIYGSPMENETRYSPARCIGIEVRDVSGSPDPKHISTSYVERQNWTVRGPNAPLYALRRWLLAQTHQPCGCYGSQLFRIQLHSNPHYTPHDPGYGCWRYRSAMGCSRSRCAMGILRAQTRESSLIF